MPGFLEAGTEVAGYRVTSFIGRGGMAVVYKAEDLRLGRNVALKLLAPELSQNDKFQQRFMRESRLAASIDHPNIIPIYEAGEVDGLLYIVMRYVDGSDLKQIVTREGPLDPARTGRLLRQVAGALDAAHDHGLVHRDVKPANILLASGSGPEHEDHAYLTDFGLTKRSSSLSGLTVSGHFLGTIDYVAPEQITGNPVDARTDVYALGCVLYECLTGTVPYQRDDDAALLWAHLVEAPPSLLSYRPELPAGLDVVIATAMAKAPDDRYASCHELAAAVLDLVGYQTGHGAGSQTGRQVGQAGVPASAPLPVAPLAPPDDGDGHGAPGDDAWRGWEAAPPGPPMNGPATNGPPIAGPPVAGPPMAGAPGSRPPMTGPVAGPAAGPSAPGPPPPVAPAAAGPAPGQAPVEAGVAVSRSRPSRGGGRRSGRGRLIALVVAVVVLLAAIPAVLLVRSNLSNRLTVTEVRDTVLPYTFKHPGSWQRQSAGINHVFSPASTELSPLFSQKGANGSWSPVRSLLDRDAGKAVGMATSFTSALVDVSTADQLKTYLQGLLPPNASFSDGPSRATVGGILCDQIEGDLADPANTSTRLHFMADVIQVQRPDEKTIYLVFFAPPDKFDSQRGLFEKVKASVDLRS
jgi:hypothetical protein